MTGPEALPPLPIESKVLSVVDRLEGAEDFYREKGIPFRSLFPADEFLNAA